MRFIKKTLFITPALALLVSGFMFLFAGPSASASYQPSFLMKNSIFIDSSTMSVSAIQNFLVARGSYLSNTNTYLENCTNAYMLSVYAHCGQSLRASQIIYDVGKAFGMNPRVIMSTLQKEQSLITDPSPGSSQLNCAMGYNSCTGYVGFFTQVDNGTWQLRYNYEASSGRSFAGIPASSYACKNADTTTHLYNNGLLPGNTVTFANPGGVAKTVKIANAATASLDCYTPYVGPYSETGYSGSYNFIVFYETYWGSATNNCLSDSNLAGTPSGRRFLKYRYGNASTDSLTFTLMNNTGSACSEAHVWNAGFTSWGTNMATGMPATSPTGGMLVAGNVAGDSRDELIYMRYGNVQVHEFSADLKKFLGIYDVAVNLSGVSASTGTFVTGDFLDRGYDQMLYIRYQNGQGNLEVHMFSKDLRDATGNYDVVNDLTGITQSSGVFVAGDFFGRGYDQLAYVRYGSATKPVEVHMFSKDLRKARGTYDVATGLTNATASTGTFVAGNFNGKDQILYVKYNSGSGKVEIHTFSADLRSVRGTYDVASNLNGFGLPL